MRRLKRNSISILTLLAAALLFSRPASAAAEVPVPIHLYHPFNELPDVLWFEGFEIDAPYYESGKYHTEPPCLPGGHAYKLGETEIDKAKVATLTFHIDKSPLKLPGGIDPKLINMEFFIFAEDAGEVHIRINHTKGEYFTLKHVPKGGMWTPISVKMTELFNKKDHMEANQICTQLRIYFKPHKGNPAVYVDNILITTNNISPTDMMPRVMVAEKKSVGMRRRAEKDGFSYSSLGQDMLQAAIKSSNKRKNDKNVLVVGEPLPEGMQIDKILAAAAVKAKVNGFNFVNATEPNGAPIAGLDDMRALIPFNLQKNETELVLLMLDGNDLSSDPRPGDGVEAVLKRVLASGSIPILCVPTAQGNDKIKGAISSIVGICERAGIPWVDTEFALKGLTNPLNGTVLSAEAMDSLAGLAVTALRHTADCLKK